LTEAEKKSSSLPIESGLVPRLASGVKALRSLAERDVPGSATIETVVDRAYLEARLSVARQEKSRPLEDFCRAAIDVGNVMVLLRGPAHMKDTGYYELALAEDGDVPRKRLLALAGASPDEISRRLMGSMYGGIIAGALEAGDELPRLSLLDRASDEYLMERVRKLSRVSVGPERIIKYMTTRETEVTLIRVILVGKLNGLSTGLLEERISLKYLEEVAK
jgi:V/A-type H+-transporting ATPase subunit C